MSKELGIFIPSDEESERLLKNAITWIKALKALNVGSDIAAYIARDMLSPMRYRPLESDGTQAHDCNVPSGSTHAQGYWIAEGEE